MFKTPDRTIGAHKSTLVEFLFHLGMAICITYTHTEFVRAQDLNVSDLELPQGFEAEPEELEAWLYTQLQRYIRAREQAEVILKKKSTSYIAHLVLALTQHYAEANFPRALYHLNIALSLYHNRTRNIAKKQNPWRWHVAILKELAFVHGAMEHFSEQLHFIARYNELYEPDMIAERAWPLMKLRRFQEARLAANLGLESGQEGQREIALNALCAIEFEMGNEQESYDACQKAVDEAELLGRSPSSVDLTNLAEAARSMFKLDVAERISLNATMASVSWYANPWLELSEMYMRQGRFEEALSALKEIPSYRALRPSHVRYSDLNEIRRSISSFLLLVGRPLDVLTFTSKATIAPDRRAHNSRDPLQDQLVIGLLDRSARLIAAEMIMEQAAEDPFYKWPVAWIKSVFLRIQAWCAAAKVKRLLSHEKRLLGVFRVGTSKAAILPPWLIGELIHILGAGVAEEAIQRAKRIDRRSGSQAYYQAFLAEVASVYSEYGRVLELSKKAEESLGSGEVLLRARLQALSAQAAHSLGKTEVAFGYYDKALQSDRGVFRRLGLSIPVRFKINNNLVAREVGESLRQSPRFNSSSSGLQVTIQTDQSSGSVCLIGVKGSILGCAQASINGDEEREILAHRLSQGFHAEIFAPRIDLSRTDINALDGSNLTVRGSIQSIQALSK